MWDFIINLKYEGFKSFPLEYFLLVRKDGIVTHENVAYCV